MDDIAVRAGVSRTLVSFVLGGKAGAGEKTRERVLRIAEELGYKPDTTAQLLARGRSRTIGVLVDVEQPFQAQLVKRIYPIAKAAGYEVLLSASAPGRDEVAAVESLIGHRCEGLILLGPSSEQSYFEELEERAVVVVVAKPLSPSNFDSVRSADGSGVRQSVDHLIELGHRDVWHIDGGSGPGAAIRSAAYCSAMNRHDLGDRIRVIKGAHDEASGIAAGQLMLDEGTLPTAVLAGNDRCALGLMDALDRAGVDVPGDVSVVGYDDSDIARLSRIDLTTVRQNVDELAENAVAFAVTRLENASAPASEMIVEPHLIVRGSTGPVRSGPRVRALARRGLHPAS
ncbi:LacI family DNA-binding transcriptional regulator [Rhodococcus sp. IEGM 1330]|uniref:LacI family DNA-binding transcriptional regulator n=1 Tax=Rhodococcus sp. IEGM 1330 TaxID=3082225 RepID=UPI002954447D|nr:LacI family DNA-binding transcriptional regulator [Rhodococcus sp. IEGM 1330]MDV8022781.1 LacI family DNA-binding transcriptional regulator [Rhodococcus sp. IEGM 1330]